MTDVAKRAGVSAMTVSRALKADGAVSDKTRLRILKAVDELGYVLDQTAGTLSSKRSGFVAALIPSLNNSNFSDTARGMERALEQSGLQLLLGATDYVQEKEERLAEAMLRRRPEGIIVTGGDHSPKLRRLLQGAGVPVVETWDLPTDPIEHVVGFSNVGAMRALVHRLYQLGYREIGFLGGAGLRDTRGAARRAGYEAAVAELGLPLGRVIAFGEAPISMDHGSIAMTQMMAHWPGVDAVVCVSDLSAFGAMTECQRRGWAVPGQIAIAGFGDFEVARCCHPRLTTVSVDPMGIGMAAGALLWRSIEAMRAGARLAAEQHPIPYQIIERETT
ncbi:LacI family DNA-binding transcriptional regulator [Acidisoma cellulosilytica]|uniref:LacI family DNA-binding transcriptional regulator n=1 Tax=Acidisoma cellulosilyticum TaxID=2802395 RepID=A0A964E397_9PROT|nr:LacI family DNA-binding transcriptional regulator [Acidisoma cellulosilyticum]MCB8880052.1 LacI family DNA-binding transcriptional regulator [Acidisoma cellulosilyticum]